LKLLTLAFTETPKTTTARRDLTAKILAKAKTDKLPISPAIANMLADDIVALVAESAEAAGQEVRLGLAPEFRQRASSIVGPLLVSAVGVGLGMMAGIVGLYLEARPARRPAAALGQRHPVCLRRFAGGRCALWMIGGQVVPG